MKIYSSYDDEPEDFFLPLPEKLYRELYDLEMAGFQKDFSFYAQALKNTSHILELGCGSGRLTRLFAAAGHSAVGIDLSTAMLQEARNHPRQKTLFLCMDMRRLALRTQFDAIIIPYNTLNLLADNGDVTRCLTGCRNHLKAEGQLLLQLYIPSGDLLSQTGKTTFQFQMFDRPQGGKVIKEILRTLHTETHQLEMTERYKIRPMCPGRPNTDYSHTMALNGNDRSTWLQLLTTAGFTIHSLATSYQGPETPGTDTGILLIRAQKKPH